MLHVCWINKIDCCVALKLVDNEVDDIGKLIYV